MSCRLWRQTLVVITSDNKWLYTILKLQLHRVEATDLPHRTIQYTLKTLTELGFLLRLGQGAGVRYQLVF